MTTMRWMALFGLAALALAGCGGDDKSGDGNPLTGSLCETSCGHTWDCLPEASRPTGDRTNYVLACALGCEIEKDRSCPDINESACAACFSGTCLVPEADCLNCNCLVFGGTAD
jgi:hypothetical protein